MVNQRACLCLVLDLPGAQPGELRVMRWMTPGSQPVDLPVQLPQSECSQLQLLQQKQGCPAVVDGIVRLVKASIDLWVHDKGPTANCSPIPVRGIHDIRRARGLCGRWEQAREGNRIAQPLGAGGYPLIEWCGRHLWQCPRDIGDSPGAQPQHRRFAPIVRQRVQR